MPATSPVPLVSGVLADSARAVHPAAAVAGWPAVLILATVALLAAAVLRYRPLVALALLLAFPVSAAIVPRPWYTAIPALLPVVALVLAAMAVCLIAATRPLRTSVPAAAAALGVQALRLSGTPLRAPSSLLGSTPELAVALIVIVAWLIGHSMRQAHVHAETLRAQAATAERLQLARDLHDQVAHAIAIIAIQAGMGRRVIDSQPGEARNALAAIEATSRQTLAGLRHTVRALRHADPQPAAGPAAADPPPGLGALTRLAATTADAGVRVQVHWHGQHRPLPSDVDTCAFRIIQEAITNVVRHAGTDHCQVSVSYQEEALAIEITDDGHGTSITDSAGAGYGITGMRERAALLSGQLTAGPQPNGGFRVAARLPLPARQPASAASR